MKRFLPIGSVVRLKEVDKKLMVFGRCQQNELGERFDYVAVPYPEGLINLNTCYTFNNDKIAEVVWKGLENEEEEKLQEALILLGAR